MSDSDDAPPPPKKRVQPRPRRVARTSSGGDAAHSDMGSQTRRGSGSGIKSPQASQTSQGGGNDEDDFFMRAKNFRELKHQASVEVPTEKDLEAVSPSTDQTAAHDSDVIPIFDFEDEAKHDKEPEVIADQEVTITKRKRELSLTPPPELPKRMLETFMTTSKDGNMFQPIVLGDDDRGLDRQSAIDVLDVGDKFEVDTGLDPELASIAAKVSSASAGSGAAEQVLNLHTSETEKQQQQPQQQSPPKEVNVLLRHVRYEWESTHLHPAELHRLTMDVKIAMNDSDPFKSMMQFYAMHKMVRPSDLIFTYRNMRLLPSATPRSLSMPPVVVLKIYTAAGYKFLKQQEEQERAKWLEQRSQQQEEDVKTPTEAKDSPARLDNNDTTVKEDGDREEENSEDAEFLFIKIRGKDTADERMRVKKSTTIAAISSHYKKLKKIPEGSTVKLDFDDETLAPHSTIADTDIEDDDMLTATIAP